MTGNGSASLAMLLKGYPRISESFISTEILLLETLGIPVEIYSLRQPRENFTHEHVSRIKARPSYLPEYIFPNLSRVFRKNRLLAGRLGSHYFRCLGEALTRAVERRKTATMRHFLQAGCLALDLLGQPEVRHLHAHFCHTPASVAAFASGLIGIPFSFTAHAKDIYTSEPDQLARKIGLARFVVTCTGHNAQYLGRVARNAGFESTPIHVVYHGLDVEYFTFRQPEPPAPPYRILSVGRLVPKKGYDDLLDALAILDRSGFDFEFVHIGSGDEDAEIRRRANALGLDGRVRMLGTLPHEEVLAHYRRSHCFVLACKVAENGDRDGIPNVLMEAMAVGLPVVSTRVSAIPELVEDGATGLLVAPASPEALAETVKGCLIHPAESRERAERARTRVETDFDNRRCVERLHALFRERLQKP